jgi:hypothetical protein
MMAVYLAAFQWNGGNHAQRLVEHLLVIFHAMQVLCIRMRKERIQIREEQENKRRRTQESKRANNNETDSIPADEGTSVKLSFSSSCSRRASTVGDLETKNVFHRSVYIIFSAHQESTVREQSSTHITHTHHTHTHTHTHNLRSGIATRNEEVHRDVAKKLIGKRRIGFQQHEL